MSESYKKAGVDVSKADQLVRWLKTKPFLRSCHQNDEFSRLGGFSALFPVDFSSFESPYLVSATDGVGTKLKIACQFQEYKNLGQDLVAMCLNDLVCSGAQPLFFLDYFSTSRLDFNEVQPFLEGVGESCQKCDCVLVGGETAEMPGVYPPGVFDCAGFAVGVVDRPHILGRHRVACKDVILGVSSSGFHSNGYSLLRKLFEADLESYYKELLTPTYLYVELVKRWQKRKGLKAVAHITGGGLDNLLRILPKGLKAKLQRWPFPELVKEVQKRGGFSEQELLKTFNCGVGLMAIVEASQVPDHVEDITSLGFQSFLLGEVASSLSSAPTWSF